VPDSVGPAAILKQPHNRERFDTSTVTWRGGDNWTDNPVVVVKRWAGGKWVPYADQSGAIQTVLDRRPALSTEALAHYSGAQEWTWTANFEIFDSYPRADVPGGQVPNGRYRFVIRGQIHTGGSAHVYRLASKPFTVRPWDDIQLRRSSWHHGVASYWFKPIRYPRMPAHISKYVTFYRDDKGGKPNHSLVCKTCTFQPWATTSQVASVTVDVMQHGHEVRQVAATQGSNGAWTVDVPKLKHERLVVRIGGVRDEYGETTSHRIVLYGKTPQRAPL
jgi:hypothetical protein